MARKSPELQRSRREKKSTETALALLIKLNQGVPSADLLQREPKAIELTSDNKEEYVQRVLQQLPEVERVVHASKETSISFHGKKILIVKFFGIEKVYVQVKSSLGGIENFQAHVMDVCRLNSEAEYIKWMNEQKIITLIANNNELDADIIKVFRERLSEIRKFHGIE